MKEEMAIELKEVIIKMLKAKLPYDVISRCTGESVETMIKLNGYLYEDIEKTNF